MIARSFSIAVIAACSIWHAAPALSETEPDIARTYICSDCTGRDAAREFIEARIVRRCEPYFRGPPGEPAPGEQPDPRLCYGPDEEAVVLNPQTESLYGFIIRRDSAAHSGQPPFVEFLTLAAEERQVQRGAWQSYLEWQAMLESVGEHVTEWVENRQVLPDWSPVQPLSSDDEELICPSGTALEALSDPDIFEAMQEQARAYAVEQYEERFDPDADPGIVVSQGWLAVSAPYVEGGITLEREELEDESYPTAYGVSFRIAEDGQGGWTSMSPPDRLIFEFDARRLAPDGAISVVTRLDSQQSRVLGVAGWAESNQSRDEMGECIESRMEQAVAQARFDDPTKPARAFVDQVGRSGGTVVSSYIPSGGPLTCFRMEAKTEDGEVIRKWIRCY